MSKQRKGPHPPTPSPKLGEGESRSDGGEGFKPTELGDLPAEWDVVRLGDLGREFFSGGTPSTKKPEYYGGNIHWTTSAYIDDNLYLHHGAKFITEKGLEKSASKLVPANNLLIGTRVGVGKVAINSVAMAISQDLTGMIVDTNRADTRFLAYMIRSKGSQERFEAYTRGTTIKGIPRKDLIQIPIPLPSLDEQRRIAHVLNTVQQAIAAQDDLIAAAQELKRSLMRRLFTYGPGPKPAPTKETNIGEVPEHWGVVQLGEVVEFASGQADPREMPYLKMPHIGPENVEEATGKILLPLKTAEELNLVSGKYLFTTEDVIYSKIRPYLRKVALPSFTGVCSADMYPLRPKDKLRSRRFLHQTLLSEAFTVQATSHQQRTGIPKINRPQLKSVDIPIPPPNEQHQIAHILQAADAKIAAEQDRKVALQELFNSLLQELMTGRRRV